MKVAVTGSEGFLGRVIVQKLKEKKHNVIECTKENCNILNLEQVKNALSGAEVVVHCAAILDENSEKIFEVNVRGTENVLEACAQNAVTQFIFLSTVGVYGNQAGIKNENMQTNPQTAYEKSKLEAEKKVLSFQEVFPITILRPALVLGNNTYWKDIIKLVRKNFPLIGDGNNAWQLVCVDDLAQAVIFCTANEDCYGETFNIAETNYLTLKEIVQIIRVNSEMSAKVNTIPFWLGNIIAQINSALNIIPLLKPDYVKRMLRNRRYSTKKIELVGWEPNCSTKEYLPQLVREIK